MPAVAFQFAMPDGKAGIFGLEPIPVNAWWNNELKLLVDLGYAHETAWITSSGIAPQTVVVTHHHPDHDGGLPAARQAWPGAQFLLADPSKGQGLGLSERQELYGGRIDVMATPGHTRPHFSLYDRSENAFYAGDLILAVGTPAAGPPDGSFVEYMNSLERVLKLAPQVIYPGHGPAVGMAQAQWTYDHRRKRLDDVSETLQTRGPQTIRQLVDWIYVERDKVQLAGFKRVVAEMTMQGYLDFLMERGQIRREADCYLLA